MSDEDKQSPERSFAMQRQRIQEQLLTPSPVPFSREYTDLLSGTNPNRKDYQQLLADAHSGRFSHLGLYRADRFGRNTVEGLQAATKLIGLGVKIRIANMPSLHPEEPDGFFMFLIQMGMAQREVDVLAMRTADGMEAKLRAGGWPSKAPEGYLNKERMVSSNKYDRWVEADPQYILPIREAWKLLLTDRYTLQEICEELTQHGYVRSSGRPWAWDDPRNERRVSAKNRLHSIFHNPFYAGWIVSDRFDIKMGQIRGKWESAVSLDQFERGKEILRRHDLNKSRQKRLYYLLRNLLWVEVDGNQYKMFGSTPTGRSQRYAYYITHAKPGGRTIRVNTDLVDRQIENWVNGVVVKPELIPQIHERYQADIKIVTQDDHDDSLKQLRKRLSEVQQEEARLARLMITGQIGEDIYVQLRAEWSEKLLHIQRKIGEFEFDGSKYMDDLDVALVLMTQLDVLYKRVEIIQRTKLLQLFVKRIIISPEGEIIGHELHSPFAYLSTLSDGLNGQEEDKSGSEQVRLGAPKNPI